MNKYFWLAFLMLFSADLSTMIHLSVFYIYVVAWLLACTAMAVSKGRHRHVPISCLSSIAEIKNSKTKQFLPSSCIRFFSLITSPNVPDFECFPPESDPIEDFEWTILHMLFPLCPLIIA